MLDNSPHAKGVLLCLIGVLVLTPDTLLIRKAGEFVSTPTLLFYRYGFHGLSVLAFVISQEKKQLSFIFSKIGTIGIIAGVLLGAANIFFTMAVEFTIVANVLVILACNPLFSAIFSWILVGDRIKTRTVLTMCVCLGAIAVIFYDQLGGDGSTRSVVGNIFAICAAVTLGLFFAVVHWAEKNNDREVNMVPCNVIAGFFVVVG